MKNGADTSTKAGPTSSRGNMRGDTGGTTGAATTTAPSVQTAQARFAQSFTSIVSVLMRDANFRKLRLADLERFVLPAIMTGQWRLAHAQVAPAGATDGGKKGRVVPAAVAIWARVSEAVDKRLTENDDKPFDLSPSEWTSGEIVWLIAVAGDRRVLPQFMKELDETVFEGKLVKMRQRGADGKSVVTGSIRAKRVDAPNAA